MWLGYGLHGGWGVGGGGWRGGGNGVHWALCVFPSSFFQGCFGATRKRYVEFDAILIGCILAG